MTAGAEELRMYTWSEYMDEEKMPADFEKKFGIKVRLDDGQVGRIKQIIK